MVGGIGLRDRLVSRLTKGPITSLFLALAFTPLVVMVWQVVTDSLGPDPAERLMHVTGEWALRFLVLTLLARPASQWGWPLLFRHRRTLGVSSFGYASLHLLIFAQVYIGWDVLILGEELVERPYVVVGALAWLLLLPLAVTSTQGLRRRLGRRWRQLHKLVYGVVVLAVLHITWLARSDLGVPLLYGGLFGALLLWRLRVSYRRQRRPLGNA